MKNLKFLYLVLSLSVIFEHSVDAYRILGVFPTRCKSHFAIGHSVMKTLAEAGHEVHVVSPFPQKSPIDNYHDIFLDYGDDGNLFDMFDTADWSPFEMINFLSGFGEFMANFTLSHPNLQDIMNKKIKFDAVIAELFGVEAIFGLGSHLNCPVITLATFGSSKWTNDLTRTPMPYSYVPHNFVKFSENMNFYERTYNMLVMQYEHIYMEFVHYGRQNAVYDQYFGNNQLPFDDQMKNVSLVLINNHFSSSSVRPTVANMIEIGGVQVSPNPNPLPFDIQQFLDSATDGAIIFSMGSILQAVNWPTEKREAFVHVFSKLKQKVLWKYENETLPNKPDNVMISPWIPQRDVLAHPNVKLFITHGGLLGTTEAIYEGVPVVGIPIYADQQMNIVKAVNMGIGIYMDYNDIDEHLIAENINKILKNPNYHKNAKTLSKVYKDRPMTPQQSVVYWVEYVIRHNGALHLRSAAHNLNFIQLHSIDSYALIGFVLFICYYSLKRLFWMVFGTRSVDVKVKRS
ncbi:UDP-glycosyltransferase UGT5-like [Chironomus tepperi]|uniref:UDP-glycosyltransferase UGT5-like n=1 Tax=Chironomus tepperi TaxID=113505 RepID=UPI00391F2880